MANDHHSSGDEASDDGGGWLTNTSSPRSPDVDLDKVKLGVILFLRKQHEIRREHFITAKMPKECLNHPLVVLEMDKLDKTITICLITSFGRRQIGSSGVPNSKQVTHLSMFPTPMHAASKYRVRLGVGKMKREGYISTNQIFKVHCSMATLYHRSIDGYRLNRLSFLILLKHIPEMESLLEEMTSEADTKTIPEPPKKEPSPELPISEMVVVVVEETLVPVKGVELLSRAWQGVSLFVSEGYFWAISELRGDVEKKDEGSDLKSMD